MKKSLQTENILKVSNTEALRKIGQKKSQGNRGLRGLRGSI